MAFGRATQRGGEKLQRGRLAILRRHYDLARRNFGQSGVISSGIYELSDCFDPQGLRRSLSLPYRSPAAASFTRGSLPKRSPSGLGCPISDARSRRRL